MNWIIFIFILLHVFCQDESIILELDNDSFDSLITGNKAVLVEFYSPGCGHCKSFAPEYERLAKVIKDSGRPCVVAKINDRRYTKSEGLSFISYPALAIYVNGTVNLYKKELEIDPILEFIDKKMRQPSIELRTEEEIIQKRDEKKLICILAASDSETLHYYKEIGKKAEDYEFYHANTNLLKKVFPNIEENNVMAITKEDTGIYKESVRDPKFLKFLETYTLPLVLDGNSKFIDIIYTPGGKKGICLFYDESTPNLNETFEVFRQVAKELRSSDYLFVGVNISDSWGNFLSKLYFIDTTMLPLIEILEMKDAMWQYRYSDEITKESIMKFVEKALKGEIKRFIRSEPEPEINNGPVYEIVGNTYHRNVLENDKDVILLLYGPACDKCEKGKVILKKLAEKLKDDNKLVFTEVDVSKNDIEGHYSQVYPIIKMFGGKDKSKPATYIGSYVEDEIQKFVETKGSYSHKVEKEKADL